MELYIPFLTDCSFICASIRHTAPCTQISLLHYLSNVGYLISSWSASSTNGVNLNPKNAG